MKYQADDRRHVEACVQQVFQKGFTLEIDASHMIQQVLCG